MHRNTIDFLIQILCPATFLTLLVSPNCVCVCLSVCVCVWIPQDFLYTRSCHLQIKIVLLLPFQSGYLFFYLPDCSNHNIQLNTESEKAMATHSSTLAWKIPWMEEPGGLQSMGSLSVGHDWATSLSLLTFIRWRRKWQPTPAFLPGESQARGSLVSYHLWGCTETEVTWQQQQQQILNRSSKKWTCSSYFCS